MNFRIITLFPEAFQSYLSSSILKRAIDKGLISVEFINLREFGLGPRRQVDDTPYGGGPGMVFRVDVMAKAISKAKKDWPEAKTILLTPQGEVYSQTKAKEFSEAERLILICGHYEGFDERIRSLVDMELSIGQYVLTGGEIAAMTVLDSVSRLIPGVLGGDESNKDESFSNEDDIEYPQYTRPERWNGQGVPPVLLSGDHRKIGEWRRDESKQKTKKYKKFL
jgi:tRNA (guanine37-N1)-methyltransferase